MSAELPRQSDLIQQSPTGSFSGGGHHPHPPSGVGLLPDIESYRGLSGLDSALFTLLVISNLDRRLSLGVGFLAAFLLKTAYEMATGATVFVSSSPDIASVPLAHAVGALMGMLLSWWTARTSATTPWASAPRRLSSG